MNDNQSFGLLSEIDIFGLLLGAWEILSPVFWPFLYLILIILFYKLFRYVFIPYLIKLYQRKKQKEGLENRLSDQQLLKDLCGLSPDEFEQEVADLFSKLGYETEVVGKSHDGGVDVKARKAGKTHYIQCKRYNEKNSVGAPEIRNFLGTLTGDLVDCKGFFVTTGHFTLEAERFAENKGSSLIELIDGQRLIELFRSVVEEVK